MRRIEMTMEQRNAAIIRLLKKRQRTLADIGRQYGITRERVRQIGAAAGLGERRRRLPEDKIVKALTFIDRGMPISHAAEAVGLPKSSLHQALCCRGLHEPQHDDRLWTEAEVAFLSARYKTPGWSAADIGDHLGRNRLEVIGKANRLKLCRPIQLDKTVAGKVRAALAADPTLMRKQLADRIGCTPEHAAHERWRALNPEADYRWRHRRNTSRTAA